MRLAPEQLAERRNASLVSPVGFQEVGGTKRRKRNLRDALHREEELRCDQYAIKHQNDDGEPKPNCSPSSRHNSRSPLNR